MNSEIEESVTFDDFQRKLEGLGEQLKLLESGQKCKHEGKGLEDFFVFFSEFGNAVFQILA